MRKMEKTLRKALATAYMQGVVDALNGEGGVERSQMLVDALLEKIETEARDAMRESVRDNCVMREKMRDSES